MAGVLWRYETVTGTLEDAIEMAVDNFLTCRLRDNSDWSEVVPYLDDELWPVPRVGGLFCYTFYYTADGFLLGVFLSRGDGWSSAMYPIVRGGMVFAVCFSVVRGWLIFCCVFMTRRDGDSTNAGLFVARVAACFVVHGF